MFLTDGGREPVQRRTTPIRGTWWFAQLRQLPDSVRVRNVKAIRELVRYAEEQSILHRGASERTRAFRGSR
jgi:hypothetical protein